MSELPDLEAVRRFLAERVCGVRVERVEVLPPLRAHSPEVAEALPGLEGRCVESISRRGKFLLLAFKGAMLLVVRPIPSGRLQYCHRRENLRRRTLFAITLEGERQLRYFDPKLAGQVHLVERGALGRLPGWQEMGPDALDGALTEEEFRRRLRAFTGQIKGVLTSDKFVAGVGDAFADEILWEACIYPFWPVGSLSEAEIGKLYRAVRRVLSEAVEAVFAAAREEGRVNLGETSTGRGQELARPRRLTQKL